MIVTQIRPRRRSCCSNLVLRRAPRPHDMKLRQHGLRSWPCWLPNAGKHSPVKTARKGTPYEKSSSPARAAFFRGLDWRGASMLHRAAIPLVTHSAASCLASGDLLVLHLKIDIFCHLSIFFLTSALSDPYTSVMPYCPSSFSNRCRCAGVMRAVYCAANAWARSPLPRFR